MCFGMNKTKATEHSVHEENYHKELKQRISTCKRKDIFVRILRRDVNCAGTTLYLIGAAENDKYVESKTLHLNYLSKLTITTQPAIGCIVAWTGKYQHSGSLFVPVDYINTRHIGVITTLDPIKVTHRDGIKGRFIVNQRIEDIEKFGASMGLIGPNNIGRLTYKKLFDQIFYLPSLLRY